MKPLQRKSADSDTTSPARVCSVEEALKHLLEGESLLGVERYSLAQARGRVLAEGVLAAQDQPPEAVSAMDGYAARACDVEAGAVLRLMGESRAGRAFEGVCGAGMCVRIFTGALMPSGADAVMVQENTSADGVQITMHQSLEVGTFVRAAGGEYRQGALMLSQGVRLDARALGLAASLNRDEVLVARRPRVAVVTCGDELVFPGRSLGRGQIPNSNGVMLVALLEEAGCEVVRIAHVRDDMEATVGVIGEALDGSDLVLTAGGASVGAHDFMLPAFEACGVRVLVRNVAMRPGKPTIVGMTERSRVLGLPGNPVSVFVTFVVLGLPLLACWQGLGYGLRWEEMPLRVALEANGWRQHYMRCVVEGGGVRPCERQDSSMLSVLAGADGLIVRPPGAAAAGVGEGVPVLRFRGSRGQSPLAGC